MGAELRLDAGYFDRAHEIAAQLRADGPAHRVVMADGLTFWVIGRYQEAREALADPRLSKDIRGLGTIMRRQLGLSADDPLPGMYRDTFLYQDNPEHARQRALVAKAFTARRVEQLRPRITRLTEDILAGLPRQGPVDLIEHVAYPLPLIVICELLGIPTEQRESLREWTSALVEETADRDRATAASAEIEAYLAELVDRKRAAPADDLISALVQVSEGGTRLSDAQLVSTLILLIVAGHDTTTSLLSNAVHHLLADPARWALLRAHPELIPGAVEELIRFDAPVAMATHRFTTVPLTYGDVEIPAGEIVMVSLLSAGRDGDRFPDAAVLQLHRDAAGHLGFGYGPHFCLGAQLARLEAEIVLGALTLQFPHATLAPDADPPHHKPSLIINGHRTLLVELR